MAGSEEWPTRCSQAKDSQLLENDHDERIQICLLLKHCSIETLVVLTDLPDLSISMMEKLHKLLNIRARIHFNHFDDSSPYLF